MPAGGSAGAEARATASRYGTRGTGHAGSGTLDYDSPFKRGTFHKLTYQPALAAAGLPTGRGGVRKHDLRHTYASLAASARIPAYRLAEYMGNASEIVTPTMYTRLFSMDAVEDMSRLARTASTIQTAETRFASIAPKAPRSL